MGIIGPPGGGGGGLTKAEVEALLEEKHLQPSVTSAALGASSVTEPKIAANAVSEGKLSAGVAALLLGAGRVIESYLGSESVSESKLTAALIAKLAKEAEWKSIEGLNAKITNVSLRVAVMQGLIFITGKLTFTEELVAPALLFTLPAGARPEKEMGMQVSTAATTATGGVTINAAGEVKNVTTYKPAASPLFFASTIALK